MRTGFGRAAESARRAGEEQQPPERLRQAPPADQGAAVEPADPAHPAAHLLRSSELPHCCSVPSELPHCLLRSSELPHCLLRPPELPHLRRSSELPHCLLRSWMSRCCRRVGGSYALVICPNRRGHNVLAFPHKRTLLTTVLQFLSSRTQREKASVL